MVRPRAARNTTSCATPPGRPAEGVARSGTRARASVL